MSLLLDALKKAEKAKEEARRRADEGGGELRLADDKPAATPAKPVLTRPELPDITAPLEILSERLAAKPATGQPSMETLTPRRPAADAQAPDRATARRVFEAKVREPNPRLPFFAAVGALSAFAVGTAVYFWIQLRPPAPLVNTNPSPAASTVAVATATTAAPAAAAPTAAAAPAQAVIPGLPSGTPASRASTAAAKPKPPAPAPRSATPAVPRDAPAPRIAPMVRGATALERAPEGSVLTSRQSAPQVHPRVVSGYSAYEAGDLATARNDYQQALREEPGNRDALLGLAAVETRAQRYDVAADTYGRLLQTDPRDAHAQAGLLALRGQGLDPQAAESRLKSLIAADPEAGVLQFTLGNLYARQQRWPEAQQVYFKAMAADPDNPDYAYNLAVSLEHVRQGGPALDYYRRALALAQKRSASFDAAAARERVQKLSR